MYIKIFIVSLQKITLYSEKYPCQVSSHSPFLQQFPSEVFDWVLNTLLASDIWEITKNASILAMSHFSWCQMLAMSDFSYKNGDFGKIGGCFK